MKSVCKYPGVGKNHLFRSTRMWRRECSPLKRRGGEERSEEGREGEGRGGEEICMRHVEKVASRGNF